VHVGAAESVDGLLRVADQVERAAPRERHLRRPLVAIEEEPPKDLPLRGVRILELVHDREAMLRAQGRDQRLPRLPGDGVSDAREQVVEVHLATGLFSRLRLRQHARKQGLHDQHGEVRHAAEQRLEGRERAQQGGVLLCALHDPLRGRLAALRPARPAGDVRRSVHQVSGAQHLDGARVQRLEVLRQWPLRARTVLARGGQERVQARRGHTCRCRGVHLLERRGRHEQAGLGRPLLEGAGELRGRLSLQRSAQHGVSGVPGAQRLAQHGPHGATEVRARVGEHLLEEATAAKRVLLEDPLAVPVDGVDAGGLEAGHCLAEARERRLVQRPDVGGAARVERVHARVGRPRVDQRHQGVPHALAHLERGLLGEGQHQDLVEARTGAHDQVHDQVLEREGLAGSRRGLDPRVRRERDLVEHVRTREAAQHTHAATPPRSCT
jgi:hypothetical protein